MASDLHNEEILMSHLPENIHSTATAEPGDVKKVYQYSINKQELVTAYLPECHGSICNAY